MLDQALRFQSLLPVISIQGGLNCIWSWESQEALVYIGGGRQKEGGSVCVAIGMSSLMMCSNLPVLLLEGPACCYL